MEVSWPGQSATVLVAFAWIGPRPTPSMAGKVRNDPPPATALSVPPRKEAVISQGNRQSKEAEPAETRPAKSPAVRDIACIWFLFYRAGVFRLWDRRRARRSRRR